jgi:hypothetical protein
MSAAMLFPPYPLHIATRGLLDGQYGVATRGYLVLPDIVSRFPSDAVIYQEGHLAYVKELPEWYAQVVEYGLTVELKPIFDLEGILNFVAYEAVVAAQQEFQAIVAETAGGVGAVKETEISAQVAGSGSIATVDDDTKTATVQEGGDVGVVEDRPGEGCC